MRKKVNQDGFQKCSHEPGGEGEGAGGEGEEVEGREGAQRTGEPVNNNSFNMDGGRKKCGGIQQLSKAQFYISFGGVHFCYCNIIGADNIYGWLLSCH